MSSYSSTQTNNGRVTNTDEELSNFVSCRLGIRAVCAGMYKSPTEVAQCQQEMNPLCRVYLRNPELIKTADDDRDKRNRI